MTSTSKAICALLLLAFYGSAVRAQSPEENTIRAASEVLREIMAIPAKAIPESLLAEAHGVAIIPGMIKGGFVVGVRHGKGVIVASDGSGAWRAPVFITVTGGSVGWQAGVQSTDVIIVFRSHQSVENLMRGKFTIGADAAVAAGPVGRQAAAATDAQLKAEILSYSRSRGLFAGVAIDGAAMLVDHKANAAYYAPTPAQPQGCVPPSALKLVEQIAGYAGPKHRTAVSVRDVPFAPPMPKTDDVESARARLVESGQRLHKMLDAQWSMFLALPAEVYAEGKAPSKDLLEHCVRRFSSVANDPRYQGLAGRAEFQETYVSLLRYRSAVEGKTPNTLTLPPPPK